VEEVKLRVTIEESYYCKQCEAPITLTESKSNGGYCDNCWRSGLEEFGGEDYECHE